MDAYRILDDALRTCVDDIKRRHVQAGQKATGKTMNALEVRMRQEGAAIIGEIWGFDYTGAWETGSRPARRKGTDEERRAMVRNLKEWATVRGLTVGMTDKQAENLAKYLAWYIKRYGSKLWREGGRRDIITPAIEATQRVLEERLGVFFEMELSNQFFNQT